MITSTHRKDCVEKLTKQYLAALNTASPTIIAMGLADKAYSEGLERAAQIAEAFRHFDDGPEAQIKRYIAEKIRRE
jgi:hypothetical protein